MENKKNSFINSFKDKKFKYGTFSTLTALFVIGIVIVINLVAAQLDLSYDLTSDKIYSLSQDTYEALADLDEDVTIYPLFKTGKENDLYKTLVDEYGKISNKIHIEYKDPYMYPQFVETYKKEGEDIPINSIIIESDKRFKVVLASDLISQELDQQTYQMVTKSVDIEPQVTNGILYVTADSTSKAYSITGHNEQSLDEGIISQIKQTNYEFEEVNIANIEKIPEDAGVIIITTPERDWTKDEAKKVLDYLQNDGNAMFFVDKTGASMDNLQSVLTAYGVTLGDAIIVEANPSNIYNGNPFYVIPDFVDNEITNSIIEKGYKTLLPVGRNIEKAEVVKSTLKIEPLLTTSSASFGKINPDGSSVNKEEGDINGPFNVAVAVTDSNYTDVQHITKIVVVGSSSILSSQVNQVIGGANFDFIVNSLKWMQGEAGNSVYITPKTQSGSQLIMNGLQGLVIAFVSIVVIPLIILIVGIIVWRRRRSS